MNDDEFLQSLSNFKKMWLSFLFWITINFPADGCFNYSTLSDADRKSTYDTPPSSEGVCDNSLLERWYRFEAAAGTKMPTKVVDDYHRNTAFPGWLKDAEPTVVEGEVNRKVRFTRRSDTCSHFKQIMMKNCGFYFIYKLVPTPTCNSRYCSTDETWSR